MNNAEKITSSAGQNVILNFGPQHPAAHGVLRLILELDGEVIYFLKLNLKKKHIIKVYSTSLLEELTPMLVFCIEVLKN